ncbi:MAG: response regulator transcription factor [Deltaproteobacteria bacterium]|nr:response regulator transcription factor [Deltaproteobacteria bacterium]
MPAPRRILVIDDSPLVLELTRSVLEAAGYVVATAATLDSFEAARRDAAPDLILIDVQMPEAFGDDLAAMLKGGYGEIAPIVLLSSLDEDELAQRAAAAKVNGWVSKRSGFDALVAKVRELLPGREAQGARVGATGEEPTP